jgi:hypothetical protein
MIQAILAFCRNRQYSQLWKAIRFLGFAFDAWVFYHISILRRSYTQTNYTRSPVFVPNLNPNYQLPKQNPSWRARRLLQDKQKHEDTPNISNAESIRVEVRDAD